MPGAKPVPFSTIKPSFSACAGPARSTAAAVAATAAFGATKALFVSKKKFHSSVSRVRFRARFHDARARGGCARATMDGWIAIDRGPDRCRPRSRARDRERRVSTPTRDATARKNTSDPSLVFRRRARVPRRPDRPRETRDAIDPRDDDDDIARAHLLASAFFAARASTATVVFCAEARMVNIVCCRSCACECPVAVAADARESRRARGEGLDDESQSEKIYRRIGSDSDLYRWGVKGHIKWVRRV